MNAIKNARNLLALAALFVLSACMGSGDKTPVAPNGNNGADASVSTCCAVSNPVNAVIPAAVSPFGVRSLQAIQVPGGAVSDEFLAVVLEDLGRLIALALTDAARAQHAELPVLRGLLREIGDATAPEGEAGRTP